MITNKTKYLILFWIIVLILFTFYCVIRLNYLREKYGDTPTPTANSTTNVINYINNIQKQNKISDLSNPPECKNLYDDNIKVQSLGYSNCQNAYADYLEKQMDVNNSFGQPKSLAEICPISSKSKLYNQCLTSLLKKFTDNANMLDTINQDMTTSINKRLQDRNGILNNIENQSSSLINNKSQTDFSKYLKVNNYNATYKDDVLGLVNNYYKNRYETFVSGSGLVIDPDIEKLFFGSYKPINGQYLVFNDITITLGYDLKDNDMSMQSEQVPQPTQTTQPPKNIIMSISSKSNGLDIIYNIASINNFKAMPNAIKLSIKNKNVINNLINSHNSQTIQQLLSTLGLVAPTQLVLTYDEFTSTENILHKTYKLSNDNLDTILILNKI